jgi:hypothetical protein
MASRKEGSVIGDFAWREQDKGLLDMEAGSHLAERIDAISSHEWIALISRPQVAGVTFDDKKYRWASRSSLP